MTNPNRNARGRFTTSPGNRPTALPGLTAAAATDPFAAAFLSLLELRNTQPALVDALGRMVSGALSAAEPGPPLSPAEVDPDRAPVLPEAPRKAKVAWRKIAKGEARIWTATVSGRALQVERKKTAKGIVFDAYIDGNFLHRSKSSVTARDRLAYGLARDEAKTPSTRH
jgi:hypothetical protein